MNLRVLDVDAGVVGVGTAGGEGRAIGNEQVLVERVGAAGENQLAVVADHEVAGWTCQVCDLQAPAVYSLEDPEVAHGGTGHAKKLSSASGGKFAITVQLREVISDETA